MCTIHTQVPLRALAADDTDARAVRGQRFLIPISVLAENGEAIVVQHRRKLLWEGVAQSGAGDLRASSPSRQRL